jgi:hypothetical protein
MEMIPDPERVSEILAPFQGADERSLLSGGLRRAATTGYYLAAFQAETDPLIRGGSPLIRSRLFAEGGPTRYREVVLTSCHRRFSMRG